MSLYNQLMGENPDATALLGMLSLTRESFQRYRDVYLNANGSEIIVYTKLGGGNRPGYKQVYTNMKRHPNYIKDYDDDIDNVYSYFVFSVPDKYKETCKKISTGEDPASISKKFEDHIAKMNKPGTPEYEKSQEFIKMFEKIINDESDGNGGIHFIKI